MAKRDAPILPRVAVLEVTGTDMDGEPLARPVNWEHDTDPPPIIVTDKGSRAANLGVGDRVLAEISGNQKNGFVAKIMRRLPGAPARIIGIYEMGEEGGRLRPTDKKAKSDFIVRSKNANGATPGSLVLAQPVSRKQHRLGLPEAKVIEVLGDMSAPRAVSLIAITTHDIPVDFPEAALEIAETAEPPAADDKYRVNLRDLPLVTIDGADARDFDDAVHAEPDTSKDNKGGWKLTVAIADVAHYVRSGSALDEAAKERGNSVYFPDRVVPMLPERLSNDLCSLRPDGDRPCLAARMVIDKSGRLIAHRFERAWMRSHARITYEEAQDARDGKPSKQLKPLMKTVIEPLYAAYAVLAANRAARGTLDLDLPEPVIVFDDDNHIKEIVTRPRLDSHRLIEEFMITANVAAAEALDKAQQPALYRTHDSPDRDRINGLSDILKGMNITLAKGQVIKPAHLAKVIEEVEGHDDQRLVHQLILRAQAQARYAPNCTGHFGLALRHYAHFTSPIRRYADLIVHRALIDLFKLGEDGLQPSDAADLDEVAIHISATERKAIAAERSANDRYMALYLSEHIGSRQHGRISGVGRFGLFVTLDQTGGDGLIPIRNLPDDYYIHDEAKHSLTGRRRGRQFRMGEPIIVTIKRADPVTGIIDLELHDSSPEKFGKAPSEGGAKRRDGRKHPTKSRKSTKGPKRNKKGKGTTPKGRR